MIGEAALLAVFLYLLYVPAIAWVFGEAPPVPVGDLVAFLAVPAVLGVDALHKRYNGTMTL